MSSHYPVLSHGCFTSPLGALVFGLDVFLGVFFFKVLSLRSHTNRGLMEIIEKLLRKRDILHEGETPSFDLLRDRLRGEFVSELGTMFPQKDEVWGMIFDDLVEFVRNTSTIGIVRILLSIIVEYDDLLEERDLGLIKVQLMDDFGHIRSIRELMALDVPAAQIPPNAWTLVDLLRQQARVFNNIDDSILSDVLNDMSSLLAPMIEFVGEDADLQSLSTNEDSADNIINLLTSKATEFRNSMNS